MIQNAHRRAACCGAKRRGFTLVELLVSISIIVLLASMVLVTLAAVQEQAREDRTRAQIARLHELLMQSWNEYETRRVPIRVPADARRRRQASTAVRARAKHEMLRLEMPDRMTDIVDPPQMLKHVPAKALFYQRRIAQARPDWWQQYQGAECLYMIISRIQVGESNGLEFFRENEIGDIDEDGLPEILDAWGTPIRWLRWPAGFESPLHLRNPLVEQGDLFDPNGQRPFTIYPLIVSAGPDGRFDLRFDQSTAVRYSDYNDNPYTDFGGAGFLGQVADVDGDQEDNSQDNIHNHLLLTN